MKILWAVYPFLLWTGSLRAESAQDVVQQGLSEVRSGDVERGLSSLRRAAQLEPGNASVWITLGLTAQEARRYDDARDALERALQQAPRSETALYNLAMVYEKLGDWSRARDAWTRFLALSPSAELKEIDQRQVDRLE